MVCPICEAEGLSVREPCPRCGAPLQPARSVGVVEGTAQRGPVSAELPPLPEAEEMPAYSNGLDGTARHDTGGTSLVPARPSLPAVLWRQPAVRAVARAGAGAVALTLGLRLLRVWLARTRTAQSLASSALPAVTELLRQNERPTQGPGERVERGSEMVETFIFMRRVIRPLPRKGRGVWPPFPRKGRGLGG